MSEPFMTKPAVAINIAETKVALTAGRVPEPEATRWAQMLEATERANKRNASIGPKLPNPISEEEAAAMIAEAEAKFPEFMVIVDSDEERDALEALLDAAGISHFRTAREYDEEEWELDEYYREEGREIQQLEEHFKL